MSTPPNTQHMKLPPLNPDNPPHPGTLLTHQHTGTPGAFTYHHHYPAVVDVDGNIHTTGLEQWLIDPFNPEYETEINFHSLIEAPRLEMPKGYTGQVLTCTTCEVELPISYFHKSSGKPEGRDYNCKSCKAKHTKIRRLRKRYKNREITASDVLKAVKNTRKVDIRPWTEEEIAYIETTTDKVREIAEKLGRSYYSITGYRRRLRGESKTKEVTR